MLLYRSSEQISCTLDKNILMLLKVVRFSCLAILEDICKPTFKHFFSNNVFSSKLDVSIRLFCLYLYLTHNHVVINNFILSADEWISKYVYSFILRLFRKITFFNINITNVKYSFTFTIKFYSMMDIAHTWYTAMSINK